MKYATCDATHAGTFQVCVVDHLKGDQRDVGLRLCRAGYIIQRLHSSLGAHQRHRGCEQQRPHMRDFLF